MPKLNNTEGGKLQSTTAKAVDVRIHIKLRTHFCLEKTFFFFFQNNKYDRLSVLSIYITCEIGGILYFMYVNHTRMCILISNKTFIIFVRKKKKEKRK